MMAVVGAARPAPGDRSTARYAAGDVARNAARPIEFLKTAQDDRRGRSALASAATIARIPTQISACTPDVAGLIMQ